MQELLDRIAAIYGRTWETMRTEDLADVMRKLRAACVCTERCETCFWAGYLAFARNDTKHVACFYILFPNNPLRPCPAGDGCTVYKPGRVRRRPRAMEFGY